MAVEAMPLFGRYRDGELIGAGRIGTVYRATDSLLGRPVALKVLGQRDRDDAVARRFVRETLAAARLSSTPYIVAVYDVGEWDRQPFIVMEYLPGGSLEERLQREGAQRLRRVVEWLEQAAAALDAAHAEGVVHGDVRPASLLLDARDEIRVADFGIRDALLLGPLEPAVDVTPQAYLPPEQAGSEPASAVGDRYALAVTAFELLTGQLPFDGDTSVSAAKRSLPCELDTVFANALAEDPAQRYGSCAAFTAAARATLADAAAPPPVGSPQPDESDPAGIPPARYVSRRHGSRKLWLLVGVLVLTGLAGALAILLSSSGHGHLRQAHRAGLSPRVTSTPARRATKMATTPGANASAPVAAGGGSGTGGSTPGAATDPHLANDEGFALMKRGEYQAALPLLEQAVRALEGQAADPYDGYANFNLGLDLIKLGRCGEAVAYLHTAEQIEPERPEVGAALEVAGRCASRRR
jgi:tetratricopeptide (TPR) repeat protein/predicted Ser/Thr protein kinase